MLSSFIKRLFKEEEKIKCTIKVRETDHSEYLPTEKANGICGIVAACSKEPVIEPIFLGPTIQRPRWWQFWRWYLMSKYNKESREAKQKFLDIFGKPCTEEDKEKAFEHYFYHNYIYPNELWFRRIKEE